MPKIIERIKPEINAASQYGYDMPVDVLVQYHILKVIVDRLTKSARNREWADYGGCHTYSDFFGTIFPEIYEVHDGYFGPEWIKGETSVAFRITHSWLVTKKGGYIIDPMPVGVYGAGPCLYSKRVDHDLGRFLFWQDRDYKGLIDKIRAEPGYQENLARIIDAGMEIANEELYENA